MSFLDKARGIVEDRILPGLQNRLDQKVGSGDKFYVRRKLFREDVDEEDHLFPSLVDKDVSVKEEELLEQGNYVVLGRSGAGKSVLALHTAVEACNQFLEGHDAPFPVFLELGTEVNRGNSQSVWDSLKRASCSLLNRALQQHEPGIYLIVDALDEMLRDERRMLTPLDTVLMDLSQQGTSRLLLTTRRSQWRESDWNSVLLDSADVYHVDKAGRYEYRQILDNAEWGGFYDECRSKGLNDLLDTPFDGFDLAFRFRSGETLPKSRGNHLSQRIEERLQKNEPGISTAVSTPRLRELARLLACVTSFSEGDSFTQNMAADALRGNALIEAGRKATGNEIERLLASRLFKTVRSNEEIESSHYAFDHVLYREALAAEGLTKLSLRKQRLLLCVQLDGRERVAAVHRGVARMLAERDKAFREHLLETDPPVALFSSLSKLSQDTREELLQQVFDWAVDQHIPPWATVEGAGESFRDALKWHQLPSPSDFLRDYLTSNHKIAKLWAAHAASTWSQVPDLKEELESIALDPSERPDVRRNCIRALEKSCGTEALPTIKSLLFDDSDRVRGTALRAYRKLTNPSPTDYLFLLQKPKQQPNLTSSLQREVRSYGQSLSDTEVETIIYFLHVLQRVLPTADSDAEGTAITGLYAELLEGVLERDEDLIVTDAPIIPVLYRAMLRGKTIFSNSRRARSENIVYEDTLIDFLQSRQDLWGRLFLYAYDRLGHENTSDLLHGRPQDILVKSATDASPDFFPRHDPPCWRQKSFVRKVRRQVSSSSESNRNLKLPLSIPDGLWSEGREKWEEQRLTSLQVERAFQAALAVEGSGAQTGRILEAIARLRNPSPDFWKRFDQTPRNSLQQAAGDLSAWTEHLSSSVYQDMIGALRSHAQNELNSEGPPLPWVSGIVEFLIEDGDHFSVNELASAFHKFSYQKLEDAKYLSARIRKQSIPRWRDVIRTAFNTGSVSTRLLLKLLTEDGEGFLLPEVRDRLEKGSYSSGQFHHLLNYLLEFTPLENATSTLRRCYRIVNLRRWAQHISEQRENGISIGFNKEDVFRPLFHLMNEPDEEAWAEFHYRLDTDSVPLRRHYGLADVEIPTPQTIEHVQILKDWYVRIRQSIDRTGDTHRDKKNFADNILSKITSFGGVDVLRMLRKVQEEAPYNNAPWLSGVIMDLESQILSGSIEQRKISSVLRMITSERYHDVRSENDLFEATREAIESLSEDLQSGKGVAGFWNTECNYVPKHEAECQNVLWPLLSQRLSTYGVRGVEEEVINENFADFRIDYPRANQRPLSTLIELEVARKGYGEPELVHPIEYQLYDEHLRPTECKHGIFIVLWFKSAERYNHPTRWNDVSALRSDIDKRAADVESRYGVTIATYVLDMTAGYRSR